jgi:hypothetical protein
MADPPSFSRFGIIFSLFIVEANNELALKASMLLAAAPLIEKGVCVCLMIILKN